MKIVSGNTVECFDEPGDDFRRNPKGRAGYVKQGLVSSAVQDFLGKPGVVGEPGRRQRDGIGPGGARQTFAYKRIPHHLVEESGRVLAADHCIAEMEVIGVGTRKASDGDFARFGALLRRVRKVSERLQNGEGAQLQRIELARVLSGHHGAFVT